MKSKLIIVLASVLALTWITQVGHAYVEAPMSLGAIVTQSTNGTSATTARQRTVRAPLERFLNGVEPLTERRAALRHSPPSGVPGAARYLVDRPLPKLPLTTVDGRPYDAKSLQGKVLLLNFFASW